MTIVGKEIHLENFGLEKNVSVFLIMARQADLASNFVSEIGLCSLIVGAKKEGISAAFGPN